MTSENFGGAELAVFAVLYYFIAIWTYGIGVPSGLFVPALLSGASVGRLWGQFLQSVCGLQAVDPGLYALLGAASVLGGIARTTMLRATETFSCCHTLNCFVL